jgi:hypothetical protein
LEARLLGTAPLGTTPLGTAPPDNRGLLAKLLQQDPKKEAAYYEELGRFIAAFSGAEAQIHTTTRYFSKTDDARARIILGGLRVVDSIDRLRALMRVPQLGLAGLLGEYQIIPAEQEQGKRVEACLKQFQLIGQQRDKLVHRTILYTEEAGFQVTNIQTAKSLASAEISLVVTIPELKAMRLDCGTIYLVLAAITDAADYLDHYRGPLPAWKYTPPPPIPQKPERPVGRRARKRQRRASQRSPEKK